MEWKLEDFKKAEDKVMRKLMMVTVAFFILLAFAFKVFAETKKIDDKTFSDETVYDAPTLKARIDERNRSNRATQNEITRLQSEINQRNTENAADQARLDKAALVGVNTAADAVAPVTP